MPPVTEEKSPPDSRMTGADSPVIADSLTEAAPSITSPSPRDASPGFDQHDVASCSWVALTSTLVPAPAVGPRSFFAIDVAARPAQRGRLRLAAALRDASAKLANSTVNHSHSDTRAG